MLVTGLQVFRTSSMARAGLLLLAALGVEGLMFLALASEFLGVLMLLMMSGEMVIMVFFMVMFMPDPGGLMGMDMTHDKRRSAALAVAVGARAGGASRCSPTGRRGWSGRSAPDVRAIGFEVMGRSMVSFLFAATTILFTMVGGVLLAKHGGRLGLRSPRGEERRMISLPVVLAVAAVMFAIGLYGALGQTNTIMVMMGVELMLGAAMLNVVGFLRFSHPDGDQRRVLRPDRDDADGGRGGDRLRAWWSARSAPPKTAEIDDLTELQG